MEDMKSYECDDCGYTWKETALQEGEESENDFCPECGSDLIYIHD